MLGAVLIDPEAYFNVSQFLAADDFYIVRNRWIWEAFTRLHEKRSPIDYLTVTRGPGSSRTSWPRSAGRPTCWR